MTDPSASHTLHRPPRAYPAPVPAEDIVVSPPPTETVQTGGGWMQTLFPLVGSVGMVAFAFVYDNKLFLYIALGMVALTLLFSIAMRMGQKRSGKRTARRTRRRYREHLQELEGRLRDVAVLQREEAERLYPDPRKQWALVLRREHLWERRMGDPDFLDVRLGTGPVEHRAHPRVELGFNPLAEHDPRLVEEARALVGRWTRLEGLAVTVGLAEAPVISAVGTPERTRGWARAVVAQLTSTRAPSDLRVLVSPAAEADAPARTTPTARRDRNAGPAPTTAAADWEWLKWLPHARGDGSSGPVSGVAADVQALATALDRIVGPRLEQARSLRAAAGPAAERRRISAPELILVLDGFSPTDQRARLPLLREALAHGDDLRIRTVLLVADELDEPADVRARLRIPERGAATLEHIGQGAERIDGIEPDAVAVGSAEALARSLAPIRLQENASATGLTAEGGLLNLLGLPSADALDPATEWGNRPRSLALRATLGVTESGERLELDLKQSAEGGMGPHGLIIGATGTGKSELLRTLVMSLAVAHPPEELSFAFIDFKGGAALADLERLAHTAGLITNLGEDLRLVDRMHDALYGEQERRQQVLRDAGNVEDVVAYRRLRERNPAMAPLPDLLVIIDEFAELLAARPDFIDLFVAIGRVGRSLGIHLLFSSQRLDEGRLRGLESNLRYRICLRTNTPSESKAVLDTTDAYLLPPEPGLAILKVDTGVYERFRTALISRPAAGERADAGGVSLVRRFDVTTGSVDGQGGAGGAADGDGDGVHEAAGPTEMRVLIDRLSSASPERVHQIWHAPLESAVPLDDVISPPWWTRVEAKRRRADLQAVVGLADHPRLQRVDPVTVDLAGSGGHMALVGAPRTGKSTALRALALGLATRHTPDEVQLHAIDLGGGMLRGLVELPHVGTVAGRADLDLARRIVHVLADEAERREEHFRRHEIDSMESLRARRARGDADAALPDLVLLVDGWAQLRHDITDLDFEIEALITRGLNYGVHVVVTANRWAEIRPSVADNLGTRLELRLNDGMESQFGRKAAEALPADIAGRGVMAEGVEWQAALPRLDGRRLVEDAAEAFTAATATVRKHWTGPPAHAIRTLPNVVHQRALTEAAPGLAGIPIGIEETRFAPVGIDLEGADPHLIVLGDSESGRTNLLRLLIDGIVAGHSPDEARILLVDPRRTLSDIAAGEHVERYAATPTAARSLAAHARSLVEGRLPEDDAVAAPLRDGFDGPRIFLLVDDLDLLISPAGNPLADLVDLLGQGRDLGLHAVVTRRVAGTTRTSFEALWAKLLELRTPGLILDGDPTEGPLLDGIRARHQPPGRGMLIRRGRPTVLVQTALADDEAPAAQAAQAPHAHHIAAGEPS